MGSAWRISQAALSTWCHSCALNAVLALNFKPVLVKELLTVFKREQINAHNAISTILYKMEYASINLTAARCRTKNMEFALSAKKDIKCLGSTVFLRTNWSTNAPSTTGSTPAPPAKPTSNILHKRTAASKKPKNNTSSTSWDSCKPSPWSIIMLKYLGEMAMTLHKLYWWAVSQLIAPIIPNVRHVIPISHSIMVCVLTHTVLSIQMREIALSVMRDFS